MYNTFTKYLKYHTLKLIQPLHKFPTPILIPVHAPVLGWTQWFENLEGCGRMVSHSSHIVVVAHHAVPKAGQEKDRHNK